MAKEDRKGGLFEVRLLEDREPPQPVLAGERCSEVRFLFWRLPFASAAHLTEKLPWQGFTLEFEVKRSLAAWSHVTWCDLSCS
jgi:hypothetical protein